MTAGQLFQAVTAGLAGARSELAKLNLRDRVQAVVFAYESGLVRPGTA